MKTRLITVSTVVLAMTFLTLPVVATDVSIDPEPPEKNVVILQLQTGSVHNASEELMLLYNPHSADMNVTDWCVSYAARSSVTFRKLACFSVNGAELWLESGGLVSLSTVEFDSANPDFNSDYNFSAGLSGSGGHLKISDSDGVEVDRIGWGDASFPETAPAELPEPGEVISRDLEAMSIDTDNNLIDFYSTQMIGVVVGGLYEVEIPVDLCSNIEGLQVGIPEGMLESEGECFEDACPEIEGLQVKVPEGYEIVDQQCALIPLIDTVLNITEVFANAPSVDDGKEFIEIFNPGEEDVPLVGYILDLGVDKKSYTFSGGEIKSNQYLSFSDEQTGIVLPNSNAALRLLAPFGNIVSKVPEYEDPKDDESWAKISGVWEYTDQITPGQENLQSKVDEVKEEKPKEEGAAVVTVYESCGAGKYRSTETNRCRNITAQSTSLKACGTGEYRSPDTNRCRKIAGSTSSTLADCPEGKERNPDTNRCRNMASSVLGATELADINEVAVEPREGNFDWPLVSLAALFTVMYMLYEWRVELTRYYRFNLGSTR